MGSVHCQPLDFKAASLLGYRVVKRRKRCSGSSRDMLVDCLTCQPGLAMAAKIRKPPDGHPLIANYLCGGQQHLVIGLDSSALEELSKQCYNSSQYL